MTETFWDVFTCGEAMGVFNTPPPRPLQWGDRVAVTFAGAEANVAIGLARLGHRVRWDSVLGQDRFGILIQKSMSGEGVGTQGVQLMAGHSTGMMVKHYSHIAEPAVAYYRGQSAFAQADPATVDYVKLSPARVLYLTGITPALSPPWADWCLRIMAEAREQGVAVWFDPNYRRKLWAAADARRWIVQALPLIDVLLCGLSEGELLTGAKTTVDIGTTLRELSGAEVVLKLGPDGAMAFASSGMIMAPPTRKITPVDPIGAGDGFATGCLSAWLDGLGLAACLARGNAVGAMTCLTMGDWEGLPDRRELEEFLTAAGGADR